MYERANRTAETFTPPKTFIRSSASLRTRKVTLLSGSIYAAASLLGIVAAGSAIVATKAGGNTGTGTFTIDPTTPVLARAKAGVYTLRCIAAAANSGTFRLEDPDGYVLGDVTIPAGAGNSVTVNEQIKGSLADATTDFAVGDGFDITVTLTPSSGKAKLAAAASTDGSQVPTLVLAYDVDASGGDVEAEAYESGDFVKDQLVFGAGISADGAREALRRLNITYG